MRDRVYGLIGERTRAAHARHVPRRLRPHAPHRRRARRRRPRLRHLRRRRPDDADEARPRRPAASTPSATSRAPSCPPSRRRRASWRRPRATPRRSPATSRRSSPAPTSATRQLLAANSALDFDDLLLKTALLFRHDEDVLRKYQERYLHVLVDEFQDTNVAQYVLARQLAGRPPQHLRRRRPRPVDLLLALRRPPQHPQLRARLPGRARRLPRAELPLDAEHPRRRALRHHRQPAAQGEEALDGEGPRRRPSSPTRRTTRRTRRSSSPPRRRGSCAPATTTTATSPSCTARTRSRGRWRRCSSARTSATGSSAARASTSDAR